MNQAEFKELMIKLLGDNGNGRFEVSKEDATTIKNKLSSMQDAVINYMTKRIENREEIGSIFVNLIEFGQDETIIRLVKKFPNQLLELKDKEGSTPLILAAAHGRMDLVEGLVELGADPDVINKYNQNVLHYLCDRYEANLLKNKERNIKLIETIEKVMTPQNINQKDEDGRPPINAEIFINHPEIIAKCLELNGINDPDGKVAEQLLKQMQSEQAQEQESDDFGALAQLVFDSEEIPGYVLAAALKTMEINGSFDGMGNTKILVRRGGEEIIFGFNKEQTAEQESPEIGESKVKQCLAELYKELDETVQENAASERQLSKEHQTIAEPEKEKANQDAENLAKMHQKSGTEPLPGEEMVEITEGITGLGEQYVVHTILPGAHQESAKNSLETKKKVKQTMPEGIVLSSRGMTGNEVAKILEENPDIAESLIINIAQENKAIGASLLERFTQSEQVGIITEQHIANQKLEIKNLTKKINTYNQKPQTTKLDAADLMPMPTVGDHQAFANHEAPE